jgi:DNA-binding NtrC family response regulator
VFEQAHEGTLFLDEIANLDLELQRQLLLVLERGVVTRLGDTRPRPARPKLVAATNQDLEALVRQGRFRSDLFMRLNPATRLQLPPLRDRRADLPDLVRFAFLEALRSEALRPLVRAFLARFPTPEDFDEKDNALVFGRPSARAVKRNAFTMFLSREALGRLGRHGWPGNHRELKLFAQNAAVFALTRHLDSPGAAEAPAAPAGESRAPAVLEIPDRLVQRLVASPAPALAAAESRLPARAGEGRRIEVRLPSGASFQEISAEVERQYLKTLFQAAGGDLERVAKELLGPAGNARRLHLRMNQLGLKLRELREGLE